MIVLILLAEKPQACDSISLPITAAHWLARPIVMDGRQAAPAFLRRAARRLNKCVHV